MDVTESEESEDPSQPSIKRARECLSSAIANGFSNSSPVLVDALPAMGKSRGVIEWAASTGNPLTVLTARHELYNQYTGWCDELNLTSRILPSFYDDCPSANGTHGEKWEKRITQIYNQRDLLPGEIHDNANELFDEELPCQKGHDCLYFTRRDFDHTKYDVLIGHYSHCYSPQNIEDRYVAIDEFPQGSFLSEYSAETVAGSVGKYLNHKPKLPFKYLKDIEENRRDPGKKESGLKWFTEHNPEIERDSLNIIENTRGYHPEAPTMTYAILAAEDLDNRWEYTDFPDERVVINDPNDKSLTLLRQPPFSEATSVIALDGTPTIEKWKLMLGNDLEHSPVLSDNKKRAYVRKTLGIQIIQTTNAANHYSGKSAISVTPERDIALFEGIESRENQKPALIVSRAAEENYREQEDLSDVVDEVEHYGNIKGSNKFSDARVGVISGSPHYGDNYIKKWSALAGKSVSRVTGTSGMGQDFGTFGNQILHGMRENAVLQAAMRFGRDGDGATVYVNTGAIPSWVQIDEHIPSIRSWDNGIYEIINVIKHLEKNNWRTVEITEEVSISEQQVRIHLKSLDKLGYITKETEGRGYTWYNDCMSDIGTYGNVNFDHS